MAGGGSMAESSGPPSGGRRAAVAGAIRVEARPLRRTGGLPCDLRVVRPCDRPVSNDAADAVAVTSPAVAAIGRPARPTAAANPARAAGAGEKTHAPRRR